MASGIGDVDDPQFTIEEAAIFLNVSPSYVAALLESGAIRSRSAGGGLRVALADVAKFKRESDARRKSVLDELTAEAEALRLGY